MKRILFALTFLLASLLLFACTESLPTAYANLSVDRVVTSQVTSIDDESGISTVHFGNGLDLMITDLSLGPWMTRDSDIYAWRSVAIFNTAMVWKLHHAGDYSGYRPYYDVVDISNHVGQ